MKYVRSKDGVNIAYEREGAGPPLVMIHGTGIDHTYWAPLLPTLQRYFTTYAVDRRGRGQSGDAEPYEMQREFEDVAALVDSIHGPVFLLGHSYGALCSLEAALLTPHIHKLGLYEPPIYTSIPPSYPEEILDTFNSLLEAGNAEEAISMLFGLGQDSTGEFDLLRSQPNWHARVLAARTIPREVMSVRNYSLDPERFKDLKTPTLLLLGDETLPVYKAATETLHRSLPHNRLVSMPQQGHEAVITAPELVVREVTGSFLGVS